MILSGLLAARPGTAAYHADAVHFDGATWLSLASLVAGADTPYLGFSYFIKSSTTSATERVLFVVDPDATYSTFNSLLSTAETPPNQLYFSFGGGAGRGNTTINPDIVGDGTWHSVVVAVDTVNQIMRVKIDRANSIDLVWFSTGNMAFNGLPFWIGDDNSGGPDAIVLDIANLRIAPGQNWLTAGDISGTTLDLFTTADNKPVDPAVATAALGAPAILLVGNAASFATNLGTGGVFTTTGILTDASTSPSD